jgi:hypothetical protein
MLEKDNGRHGYWLQRVAPRYNATPFFIDTFDGAADLLVRYHQVDFREVPMPSRATLAWLAGILTVLLLALVVISGMQGRTSDAEARLDYPPSQVAPLAAPPERR